MLKWKASLQLLFFLFHFVFCSGRDRTQGLVQGRQTLRVAGDREEATNLGISSWPTPALALLLFCPRHWLHLKTTKTIQIPPLRTVRPREVRKCQVIGKSVRGGAENPGVPASRLRLFHNQVLPGNHALSTSCWIWDGHTDSTPEHFPVSAARAERSLQPPIGQL